MSPGDPGGSGGSGYPGGVPLSAEPSRVAPAAPVGRRFAAVARRDTAPEMGLRRVLHHRGRRYRVNVPVPGLPRRSIDIAFGAGRVAVFVDGCFWHGCPQHSVAPRANADWWQWKLGGNRARDGHTTRHMEQLGWTVVRVWEHEDPQAAADRVEEALNQSGHAGPRPSSAR